MTAKELAGLVLSYSGCEDPEAVEHLNADKAGEKPGVYIEKPMPRWLGRTEPAPQRPRRKAMGQAAREVRYQDSIASRMCVIFWLKASTLSPSTVFSSFSTIPAEGFWNIREFL